MSEKYDKEVQLVSKLLPNVKAHTAAETTQRVMINKKMAGVDDKVESHIYFCKNMIRCFIKSKTLSDFIKVLTEQLHSCSSKKGYGIHVLGTPRLYEMLFDIVSKDGILLIAMMPSKHKLQSKHESQIAANEKVQGVWMHMVYYAEIANMQISDVWTPWDSCVRSRTDKWTLFRVKGKLYVHCASLHVDLHEICETLKITLPKMALGISQYLKGI